MIDELTNIHQYIHLLRLEQRLSIQELAKKSGVSASFISRIETQDRNPSSKTLEKLAPHLNINYVKLLEVANLLAKDNSEILHLEEVLQHANLYWQGKIIDENTRRLLLHSIAYQED
ncbi:helix-turn-helix transcriptional regulator [Paenibacillus sp. 1182]|uniref:helix-turn-helix domain-containing protein n=1 Tax=Paenibacillus sp. 1182 TaxID=2806565 RepID=UPI001AE30CDE